MKNILDRSFIYTPSAETDLRKTFARIRREQQKKSTLNTSTLNELPKTKVEIDKISRKLMKRKTDQEGIKNDSN